MPHAKRPSVQKTRDAVRRRNATPRDGIMGFMAHILNKCLPPFMRGFSMRQWIGGVLGLCALIWVGAIFIAGGVHTKFSSMISNTAINWSSQNGFVVKDILVEGRTNLDKAWLQNYLGHLENAPLMGIKPTDLSSALITQNWVKAAQVQRLWPDRIKIKIWERTPFLLQPVKGRTDQFALLDEKGYEIGLFQRDAFPDLPIITGEESAQNAANLIPLLHAEPTIYPLIAQSLFVGQRRWDVILKNGLRLKLPESDMGLALRRLALAQAEHDLFNRPIAAIDLRDQGRIVLEMKDGENEEFHLTNPAKPL